MSITQIKSNVLSFIQPTVGGVVTVRMDPGIDWIRIGLEVYVYGGGIYQVLNSVAHNWELLLKSPIALPGQVVPSGVIYPTNSVDPTLMGVLKTPTWIEAVNGETLDFPEGIRGDGWIIQIKDFVNDVNLSDGFVWLGGISGIVVGYQSWIICLEASTGGDYATVGHKYLVINQKKGTSVITVSTYSALPSNTDAQIGVIYLVLDTGNTYYFDTDVNDYVQIGTVVEGTLISPILFEDENNIPVTPDGSKLYLDTVTGLYYRWNGAQYVPLITPDNEAKWGNITGDIEDQDDLIALVGAKLDKPLSDGTFLVKKNGLAVTYVSADSFGQNIANTNLTTTAVRTFTQAFTYTHATDGKIYYVTGLPNKNVDETFRKFRVQDANGQQAIVDKEELYDTKEYKAISSSGIEPTLAELNTFDTDRVDFPNLNRVYLKNGYKWTYFETIDVL